ncbi:MAG TPA: hypothetical protein VMG10_24760 [Gemmataceae bacterium]|nr:hypothetical protein [Gemmataceae bacterium]
MRRVTSWGGVGLSLFAALVLIAAGCNKSGQSKEKDTKPAQGGQAKADTKHSGWWCDEHGIPEAECSMCNAKVAAEFKKKGDWCDKHERALSQCFICNPKAREKYAAMYRAKYGKEPPPTEDD